MESFNKKLNEEQVDISDYIETPFYSLISRLPEELAIRHLGYIEDSGLNDDEATQYLESILERRKEANTETKISDKRIDELFGDKKAEIFNEIETEVFTNPYNSLGFGRTAKVKRYDLESNGEVQPIAVKYLITPTEKTLSASGEHDMIHEVELLKSIEEVENGENFNYISVPHPYFHHKNTNIQCYGMQMIDGADLENAVSSESELIHLSDELQNKLMKIDTEKLKDEITSFYKRMHTLCLHGDIKPKNIMVDEDGKFYIIDFGQAVMKNDMTEKSMEQYQNLMEDEVKSTIELALRLIRKIKSSVEKLEQ